MSPEEAAWFKAVGTRYRFPDRYIVFDLETTGFSASTDMITQIGYVMVDGGRVTQELSFLLNWIDHGGCPLWEMTQRLDRVRESMQANGHKPPAITVERLRSEGVPPREALAGLSELFTACKDAGVKFVAHCGYHLDSRMLAASLTENGRPFTFGPADLWDTGSLAKGSQIREYPKPGETLSEYMRRLLFVRKNGAGSVKYSLAGHCAQKYGLEKFGIDLAQAHDALVDCRLTYRLFETFREYAQQKGPQ